MPRQQRRPIGGGAPVFVLVALLAAAAGALPAVLVAAQDLAGDRAALLALRAALDRGAVLPWNPADPSPCGWRGVLCSNQTQGGVPVPQRVIELRLPGKSLVGAIPPGTVGNLTALQVLSLRHNGVTGEIPGDIGNCGQLTSLNLTNNQLTGAVPEALFSLAALREVGLSRNRLTGGVSPEFNRLTQLDTLFLDRNDLAGDLPPGLDLPSLKRFNVSFNPRITGAVPSSLAGMPASAFSGTALCDGPSLPTCPSPAPPPASPSSPGGGKKKRLSRWAVVGIVAAAAVLLLLVVGLFACLRRRRAAAAAAGRPPTGSVAANVREATEPITVTLPGPETTNRDAAAAVTQSHAPPLAPAMISEGKKLVFLGGAPPERPYDLEALLRASAEVLAKGPLGTTYRATLDGGEPVLAIKRLREVHLSEKEFHGKATALGALNHQNLTRLRAYFYSKEEKLLVYDFVGAGSLSALLHDGGAEGRARLDFTARARIALAAARGVAFVHHAGAKSSHGNIKSSNVVVAATRDGAYVSDCGVAQLVGAAAAAAPAPPPRRGGGGYHAPEVSDARSVPQSADVYSFGVVLLELLSGRAPLPEGAGGGGSGVDLPRWVRSVVQEEWTSEVFDAAIANEPRFEAEMMRLLQLGMECTEQRPDRRPTMAEVEARIERIVEDACRKADFSSTDGSRSISA